MEYDNDYKSKYTTHAYQNYTILKIYEQKVKNDTDANPPRGVGEQARKSLFEKIFIFISRDYNIRKLKLIHLFLIWNETEGLQIAKI